MTKPFRLSDLEAQKWMKVLLIRAEAIGLLGEVPVTALILDVNGKCIGNGENRRERDNDPMGHAEIMALREASNNRKDWRFNDCTMIVTLEPCVMCAGALIQARMGQVIFAANDNKRGAFGGALDLSKHKSAHHKMIVQGGILENLVQEQLQNWFKKRRMANF